MSSVSPLAVPTRQPPLAPEPPTPPEPPETCTAPVLPERHNNSRVATLKVQAECPGGTKPDFIPAANNMPVLQVRI